MTNVVPHPSSRAALDHARRSLTASAIDMLESMIELDCALQSPNCDPALREAVRPLLAERICYLRSLLRSLLSGTDYRETFRALLDTILPDT